jgi:hypothetical protein
VRPLRGQGHRLAKNRLAAPALLAAERRLRPSTSVAERPRRRPGDRFGEPINRAAGRSPPHRSRVSATRESACPSGRAHGSWAHGRAPARPRDASNAQRSASRARAERPRHSPTGDLAQAPSPMRVWRQPATRPCPARRPFLLHSECVRCGVDPTADVCSRECIAFTSRIDGYGVCASCTDLLDRSVATLRVISCCCGRCAPGVRGRDGSIAAAQSHFATLASAEALAAFDAASGALDRASIEAIVFSRPCHDASRRAKR